MGLNKFIQKIIEWEYWPSYMFYVPNLPYAFYLMLKAKNLTFYSVVNPGIKSSGNGTESKFKTLELIPEEYRPKSLFVPKNLQWVKVLQSLEELSLEFPLIAKPDVGFRGMLVEKIKSKNALKTYLKDYPIDVILQEYISLPKECGVFYYRIPDQFKGFVSSLTYKSFLQVEGDGVSSLAMLIRKDSRASHYMRMLKKKHAERWSDVPVKGEKILLSEIGNHIRGTEFINANQYITEDLVALFDALNKRIPGWYYGRLDVKYKTWEDLLAGRFVILEINGTISEPTHIYDPHDNSYFKALNTFRRHWDIIYKIALVNMKAGVKPKEFGIFWKEIMGLKEYIKKVKTLSKRRR